MQRAKKLKIMKTSKNSFNIYFRLFFVAKTYVIQIMTSIAPALMEILLKKF